MILASQTTEMQLLNPALLFGLILFAGTLASRFFQKFNIPQVVGCIVIGIILGDTLGVISAERIEHLEPFTMFALGLIGFMIGGELRGDVFKKYGRQFFIILFSQGIGAFLLVAISTAAAAWLMTSNIYTSIAVGLVLGAIASATAPAATVNVLWEFKTRGPLTAAVLAIVALDDALALLLYRGAATGAQVLLGTGHQSVLSATLLLFGEILGAIALGFAAGFLLFIMLKLVKADDKILGFSLASLLLVVGISMVPDIDPILPAMTFGITIANLAPRQSRNTFDLVGKFSPPIYTAFFVLAGAHMEFDRISEWMIFMIVIYVLFRAGGKIFGSWFGARISMAPAAVRKYLGLCLLPQAGVAIGLAILAGQQFNSDLGRFIIMVVMTGTFLMEIIGPVLVKVGVKKAGEVGLNITEEDLIKMYPVGQIMDTQPTTLHEATPLHEILEAFSTSQSVYYPVVDADNQITGTVTISGIKEMFANQDVAGWLLAMDVAEPVLDKTYPTEPLEEALEHMQQYHLEFLPVVENKDTNKLMGILDYQRVQRKISTEVLTRRKTADEMSLSTGL